MLRMRLATVRMAGRTRAAIVEGDRVRLLDYPDVGAFLRSGDQASPATGGVLAFGEGEYERLVQSPSKVLCIGLNYRSHAAEMGVEPPQYPGIWAKFTRSLIGARDVIRLPRSSEQCDFEVELTIVIGREARDVSDVEARAAIAGYTVANDISVRDWQFRTREALQGKAWEAMTPIGPVLVTPDEIDHARDLRVECFVDGERMQDGRTSDLIFDPGFLVSYISTFITLEPGDLILTGTPSGVGFKRNPPQFLKDGQTVLTRIEGIGELVNRCVREVDRRTEGRDRP
jgi:acylpyruvate hydrolase